MAAPSPELCEAAWQEEAALEKQAQLPGPPVHSIQLSPYLKTGDSCMLSAELFMRIRTHRQGCGRALHTCWQLIHISAGKQERVAAMALEAGWVTNPSCLAKDKTYQGNLIPV